MSNDSALAVIAEKVDLAMTLASYGVSGVRLLEKVLDPTPGFIAARDQMDIEWFANVVRLLNDVARRLSALERENLRERLKNHEAVGVLAEYVQQAHHEPMDDRRRMLEHAAAGLANLNLQVAELARVQRVLRELEPEHLVVLYKLWLAKGEPQRGSPVGNRRAQFMLEMWLDSGAESLETAGCIRVRATGGGAGVGTHEELDITGTGLTVLRALRSYIAVCGLDRSTIPGHEVTEAFCSEEQAKALIFSVPGLYEALLLGRKSGFIQYDAINIAKGAPANGKAKFVFTLPRDVGEALRQATVPEKAEMGQPVSTIFVESFHVPEDDPEKVYIQVAGPHDVLRWLAYDLDAWWA